MKILNFRKQLPGTKVLAIFDLEVDVLIQELDIITPWINRNWKVLSTQNGGHYPSSPSLNLGPREAPQWAKYDELDERFKQQINKKIMDLLKPFLDQSQRDSEYPF